MQSCVTSFIFLIVFSLSLMGQNHDGMLPDSKSINLKFYNTDNGISHNNTVAIAQDNQGFIWLGTLNGLNRFDSQNFRTYFNHPNDSTSITNNVIRHIASTQKGEILIATSIGFNLLDTKTGKFKRYLKKFGSRETLGENSCYATAEDRKGNIWIGTWYNKIHYLNRKTNKITTYQLDIETTSETIQTLFVDEKNDVWVGTRGGLFIFSQQKKKFLPFYNTVTDLTIMKDTIFQVLQDSRRRVLIAKSHGVDLYDIATGVITKLKITTPEGIDPITNKKIFAIAEDKQGFFWIGTSNGLVIADPEMKYCRLIEPYNRNRNGLKNAIIRCIYVDNLNNVWLCAQNGIYIYNKYVNQFKYASIVPEKSKWEASYSQTRIYEGKPGEIWVALDEGYKKLIPAKGKIENITNESIRKKFPFEVSVGDQTTGYFLPALNEQGLFYYNPKRKSVSLLQQVPGNNRSISGNYVIKVFKDSYHRIWVGTNSNGLNRYEPNIGGFIRYTQDPNDSTSLANNWLFDIAEDTRQNIWIATWSGLCKYNAEKNCFKRFLWYNNILIFNITKSVEGYFWLGTSNGLIKFDPVSGKIVQVYTTSDGLLENIVHGVLIDKQKNLWLSSTKGITKFNPSTGKAIHFDISDGLQDKEFFRNAFLKTSDGMMYFAGINGVNYFQPEKIVPGTSLPPIVLTDFKILNQSLNNLPGYMNLGDINSVNKLKLSYKHYIISIDYVALNYVNPSKCRYKYKLVPFDKSWNEVGNQRTATYTNLPDGDYTFEVLATNNFGVWNPTPKQMKITIEPPFWRTWWFRSIAFFFVITALYTGYRIKVYLLTREQIELERQVHERTIELKEQNGKIERQAEELRVSADNLKIVNELLLEKQNVVEQQKNELILNNEKLSELNSTKDKFFSIIAHDLRNPFNAVQGFSELLSHNFKTFPEEKVLRYLKLIHSSSKNGNYLLENLLQWSRAQTGHISFNPVTIEINSIFRESVQYFESDISRKKTQIIYELDSSVTVHADENMIRTVIRNLISNAIKFTPEAGSIKLIARQQDTHVEVIVEDSGVGISEMNRKLLFKIDTNFSTKGTGSEPGTGLGLILCREFIQKHQGQIWVESEVGVGSRFIFVLP